MTLSEDFDMLRLQCLNEVYMILMLSFLFACGEQMRSLTGTVGTPASIICYSGGTKIYEGKSTGKPASEASSDGYWWVDAQTKKLVEVSADCVFSYD